MTTIEWTDETWNPVRGCSLVSAGCTNCYAMRQAHRFSGPGKAYEGLTRVGSNGPTWTGKVRLVPELLEQPLRWKKPRRIFVNSMSDLFHEGLTHEEIAAVFGTMAACPQHTFQILTKRPERAFEWFKWLNEEAADMEDMIGTKCPPTSSKDGSYCLMAMSGNGGPEASVKNYMTTPWPLPNVHLGLSVEDQKTADERIPLLLQTPAAVRFVSYEPALGQVDFRHHLAHGRVFDEMFDWLIVGGESGPHARPFDIRWARDAIAQCKDARVPVFVKQLGAKPEWHLDGGLGRWAPNVAFVRIGGATGHDEIVLRDGKGGDWDEWPADLRVRQFPFQRPEAR